MSSISSGRAAGFSGLGVGCSDCDGGMLLKKDVMGLYTGFGFAGDLAGDFLVAGLPSSLAPFDILARRPLFGRFGGGERVPSVSESDESTTGFLRGARGLPIPPRDDRSGRRLAANCHPRNLQPVVAANVVMDALGHYHRAVRRRCQGRDTLAHDICQRNRAFPPSTISPHTAVWPFPLPAH